MNTDNANREKSSPPSWRTIVKHLLVTLLVLALILFLPAGGLVWAKGWLFLVVFLAAIIAAVVYLRRVNPEIFVARSRIHKGIKLWDKILLCFLLPAFFAVLVIAALDDGRFKWSNLPWWAVGTGYALFAAGFVLMTWAQAVNRFFEPGVRIQTERGHHVVDTGPYAFVRHPRYVGAFLLSLRGHGAIARLFMGAGSSVLWLIADYSANHFG